MSPHPPPDEVEAAYALVWEKLGERSIESLIDLPRSSDEEFEAAMAVLGELFAPAIFTDAGLLRCICATWWRSRSIGASPARHERVRLVRRDARGRVRPLSGGLRFGKLARDLVALHGFAAFECKTLFSFELVSLWTSPLDDALAAIRACRERGLESGDISVACAAHNHIVSDRLVRGDALDAIWPDTRARPGLRRASRLPRRGRPHRGAAALHPLHAGRTRSLATFGDAEFDEAAFEAALTPDRMATMIFWYWVIKGQARFIAGEHDQAARAFERAEPMVAASPMHIQNLDYHYFCALNLAALGGLTADQRRRLDAHHAQLARWAEGYPPTFADKERLVTAESRASTVATWRRCGSTKRPSGSRASTASCKTKPSPARSARASTRS